MGDHTFKTEESEGINRWGLGGSGRWPTESSSVVEEDTRYLPADYGDINRARCVTRSERKSDGGADHGEIKGARTCPNTHATD